MTKRKKTIVIISVILVLLLIEWLFIGYRFNFGPFKSLGDIRMGNMPGNSEEYSMTAVSPLESSPLKGQKVLFLGSSVTYGSASLRQGIPEYFSKRLGCEYTKEAVSGTTLVDNGKNSYVQRLINNVDKNENYSLVVCQLSTNDASKKMPLGEISESRSLEGFDTSTVTGAMEYIICYSMENWNCPVVFYTGSRYENAEYEAMVARVKELEAKWGIKVLDLWSDDSFNNLTDEERNLYMCDDIHPTKAGYRDWWCPELEKQLLDFLIN